MRTPILLLSSLFFLSPLAHAGLAGLDGVVVAKKEKKEKEKTVEATPAPAPVDTDADGVPDASDKCADQVEDRDGFEDGDGCLDADNDADGVLDADDKCPTEAENKDGWADEDGCSEAAAAIKPFMIDAELSDGTMVKAKVVRIVAVKGETRAEPAQAEMIAAETEEFETPWDNVKGITTDKLVFTEAVDCYSEGVEDLGEDLVRWVCTLKHPMKATLLKSEVKGPVRFHDSQLRRFEFWLEVTTVTGPSAEWVKTNRRLDLWMYRLVASEKNAVEYEAVSSLQAKLREALNTQIKKATFTPIP